MAADEIPVGKMLHDGELVDDECRCDGTDDGYYACSFPPCVAEREAEAKQWEAYFHAAPLATAIEQTIADLNDAYERNDPKHPDYLERVGA